MANEDMWTRVLNGYVSEASLAPNEHPCGRILVKLKAQRDRDGDIMWWQTTTICCGELTLFNIAEDTKF
jgi:hypothetical protein